MTKPCRACGSLQEVHSTGSVACLQRQILHLKVLQYDAEERERNTRGAMERLRVMYKEDTSHLRDIVKGLEKILGDK